MIDERDRHEVDRPTLTAIPPELLLRRDRHLRFERGGIVYATDGRIGVLKQVVVDESAGEIAELIVKLDRGDYDLRLLPEVVDKTAGSAVFLMMDRENALVSTVRTVSQPTRLVKVDHKALIGKDGRLGTRMQRPRRAIAQAGKDFVETSTLPVTERAERRVLSFVPNADRA